MKNILVASDGSAGAGRAIAVAAELAKGLGAELVAVTVEESSDNADLRKFSQAEGATLGDIVEAASNAILNKARRIAAKAGVAAIKTRSVTGDPAEAILHVVERAKIDMVVVGRRGRGRLQGLLLGSVSQKLVTLAPCTVVVVP